MKSMIVFFLSVCFLLTTAPAAGNDDPVFIRIDGEEITVSEFEEIYRRSNVETAVAEPKTVEEYVEMYINFRLKVLEAIRLGYDTASSFVEELAGYRQQLAQQYLVDYEVSDQLLEEAAERIQYDIRASHLLLNVHEHASPQDTLAVYEQMMDIRERALQGESFADLVRTYSDDQSARDREATQQQPARRGNAGDLGYFTVFNMVYPFESAAYNTPVGEISMPVRTSFGYHLIKVHERLPAMGRAKVSHIMLMTPIGTSDEEIREKEEKIFELHRMIQEGADFADVAAMHSEDRQSGQRGGEMPAFTSNRMSMVPQFIKAISEMEEGDISEPVRTNFGWHIIKLMEKNPPSLDENTYSELRNRIQRDARARLSQSVVVNRLKQEFGLNTNQEALESIYDLVDTSVFAGQWNLDTKRSLDEPLVSFGTRTLTRLDFVNFIMENQQRQAPIDMQHYVNMMFDRFISEAVLAYEESQLEDKYPGFRKIMKEYHDGILLFEITDQKVWSRAASDTTGMRTFFDTHAEKHNWESFDQNRGSIIAEYQNYLEEQWLKELRKKYSIYVNRELLPKIKAE